AFGNVSCFITAGEARIDVPLQTTAAGLPNSNHATQTASHGGPDREALGLAGFFSFALLEPVWNPVVRSATHFPLSWMWRTPNPLRESSMSYYARTPYDPMEYKAAIANAGRLIGLFEETFNDLIHIGKGCRVMLAEMKRLGDSEAIQAELTEILARLERAAA